jgi:hypothetical protein
MNNTNKLSLLAVCCFMMLNIGMIALLPTPYSPFVDPFSESFHADSGKNFVTFGLLHNAGLATISKEWIVGWWGETVIQNPSQEYFVYTHYPSVSDFIAGIGGKIFGVESTRPLRIIPLMLNGVLLFIFLKHVFSLLPQRQQHYLFLLLFLIVPMGWNSMHAFSHHGYALYVSLAFIGVMLPVFQHIQTTLQGSAKRMALLFGFLTGLFTFDYFFIALGTPLAVCLLFHSRESFTNKILKRQWLVLGCLAGVGFALAHAVHFMQVVAYYGSFTMAFQDIFGSALYRLTGNEEYYSFISGVKSGGDCTSLYCQYINDLGAIKGRFMLLFDYLTLWTSDVVSFEQYLPNRDIAPIGRSGNYLMLPIVAWGILAMGVTFICKKKFPGHCFGHCCLLFLSTLMISSLWVFLIKNHGTVHVHLLPRHYYFCYIMLVLFVTRLTTYRDAPPSS